MNMPLTSGLFAARSLEAENGMPGGPERAALLVGAAASVFEVDPDALRPSSDTTKRDSRGHVAVARIQARMAVVEIGTRLRVATRRELLDAMGLELKRYPHGCASEQRFRGQIATSKELAGQLDEIERRYIRLRMQSDTPMPAKEVAAVASTAPKRKQDGPFTMYGSRGVSRSRLEQLYREGWKIPRLATLYGIDEVELYGLLGAVVR